MFNSDDFKIVPIFHPSEKLCQVFASIEIHCAMDSGYCNTLFRDLDKDYFNIWAKEKNVFTFAGYYEKQIIGFVNGYLDGDTMLLNSLYVEPGYHYCGLGKKLLQTAEMAVSVVKPSIKLFPLTSAHEFYQQYGYNYVKGNKYMMKNLPQNITGVVPVFEWSDELQAKLNVKIDNDLIQNYKHKTMFVYVDKDNKIDGIAFCLPNGKEVIKLNDKQKSLAKYRRLELSMAMDSCR